MLIATAKFQGKTKQDDKESLTQAFRAQQICSGENNTGLFNQLICPHVYATCFCPYLSHPLACQHTNILIRYKNICIGSYNMFLSGHA
jgi:hypothetical protein